MKQPFSFGWLLLLFLCLGRLEAGAQVPQYSIDWHVVAGGGGTTTGTGFEMSATIGQAAADVQSNGGFSLAGGYNTFNFDTFSDLANDDLSGLATSVGSLSPAFAPGIGRYEVAVSNATTSIAVVPVALAGSATITVNGIAVASGSASGPVNVPLVSNIITVVCTSGNGLNTKTYTLNVTRPALQFASNLFTVSSSPAGALADIVVNRTGVPVGAVSCVLNSTPGTALAPAQYTAQVNTAVNFTAADTVQHVMIPITANATTTTARVFTVTLSSPGAGIQLGTPITATVVILPPNGLTETVKPVVTIVAPAANALLNEVPTALITGKVTDNVGVARVQVSTDKGANFNDATLSAVGTPSTNFSFSMTPVTGLNTVQVRATDYKGNVSVVVSRSFTQLRTLTVAISGSGSVTSGFVPNSFRQVGKIVSITATPAAGKVFDGWTGANVSTDAAELPSLSFVMQPNLSITAHFITNPFVPAVIGTFNGLATPILGTTPANDTVGMLQNAVVSGNGSFTSTLKIDGLSVPLNGKFDNVGIARFGIARKKTTSIVRPGKNNLDVALQIDMSGVSGTITGTVKQSYRGNLIATSNIVADRAGTLAPASLTAKPFTLILPSLFPQTTGIAKQYFPQGTGYATMAVSVKGVVSLTGKLADNTTFSGSAPLSKTSQWPVFAPLYTAKGSISGMANLADAAVNVEDVTGTLIWFRPEQNVQWYPYGWNDGLSVGLLGARYAVPASGSVFPALQAMMPNATLVFSNGLIAAPISQDITIASTNLVTPAGVTAITKASGLFSGTFTHSDGSKLPYQGVILQKGAKQGGWGYFMSRATPLDYLGEGGSVKISAK